jgi:hypothetical protein
VTLSDVTVRWLPLPVTGALALESVIALTGYLGSTTVSASTSALIVLLALQTMFAGLLLPRRTRRVAAFALATTLLLQLVLLGTYGNLRFLIYISALVVVIVVQARAEN